MENDLEENPENLLLDAACLLHEGNSLDIEPAHGRYVFSQGTTQGGHEARCLVQAVWTKFQKKAEHFEEKTLVRNEADSYAYPRTEGKGKFESGRKFAIRDFSGSDMHRHS